MLFLIATAAIRTISKRGSCEHDPDSFEQREHNLGLSASGDPQTMFRMTKLTHLTSALGIAIGSMLLAGCGGAAAYCDSYCDCEGCSDAEYDDCIDDIEDQQKLADDQGCADQADDYLSCVNSEAECRDGRLDADGCVTEFEAVVKCVN